MRRTRGGFRVTRSTGARRCGHYFGADAAPCQSLQLAAEASCEIMHLARCRHIHDDVGHRVDVISTVQIADRHCGKRQATVTRQRQYDLFALCETKYSN